MSEDFKLEKGGEGYLVLGKESGHRIGFIRYRPKLKKWIFYTGTATGFSASGLKELASALEGLK